MKNEPKSWSEVKTGQKFKVVSNSNSHNYGIGEVYTSQVSVSGKITELSNVAKDYSGNSLKIQDIELVYLDKQYLIDQRNSLVEDFEKTRLEHEENLNTIDSQISFLEETKLEDFDPKEYQIYSVLKELKNSSSDIEKMKAISKIID